MENKKIIVDNSKKTYANYCFTATYFFPQNSSLKRNHKKNNIAYKIF